MKHGRSCRPRRQADTVQLLIAHSLFLSIYAHGGVSMAGQHPLSVVEKSEFSLYALAGGSVLGVPRRRWWSWLVVVHDLSGGQRKRRLELREEMATRRRRKKQKQRPVPQDEDEGV